MPSLRDIWAVPSIAIAALATGYGCVAALGFFADRTEPATAPSVVQPLPLVRSPEPPRFAADDRSKLARAIETELARVGCYGGAKNGVWTPATRDAMQAFVVSVNAQLPTDAPDEILLMLAESHKAGACGSVAAVVAQAPEASRAEAVVIAAPAAPDRTAGDAPPPSAGVNSAPVGPLAKVEMAPEPARSIHVSVEPIHAAAATPPAASRSAPSTVLAKVELLDGADASPPSADEASTAPATAGALAAPGSDYAGKPRKKAQRKSKNFNKKPPKFVKSFMRSVNKTLSSLGF